MGAARPGGPRGPRGGFGITPGGPGPGIRPPKEGDSPGIRPPRIDPPRTPDKGNLFGGLMDAIKQTDKFKNKIKEGGKGIGGPVTAPGFPSDRPKPPVFDDRVYMGGSSPIPGVGGHEYLNNPKYAEHRKEYYGRKNKERERERIGEEYVYEKNKQLERERPKGRPAPDFLREKMLAQKGPKKPEGGIKTPAFGDIGVGGGPGDIPPSFPTGPRVPRREGVFFGEKESPKKVMRKAGSPVDAETKNKFEEMLAYMKSFQR